jgi:Ni2+-binding GTPase involved in maturation of urease and hydrogenase
MLAELHFLQEPIVGNLFTPISNCEILFIEDVGLRFEFSLKMPAKCHWCILDVITLAYISISLQSKKR